MSRRLSIREPKPVNAEVRRCTVTLSEDLDLRLELYARKHRLTRSQAMCQAVAALVRGMRLGFGSIDAREDDAAA